MNIVKKAIEILWQLSQDVLTIRPVILGVFIRSQKEHGQDVLSGIPPKLRKTVKAVCSDMYGRRLFTQHKRYSANGSKSSLIAFMWRSCIARLGYVAQARTPAVEARAFGRDYNNCKG